MIAIKSFTIVFDSRLFMVVTGIVDIIFNSATIIVNLFIAQAFCLASVTCLLEVKSDFIIIIIIIVITVITIIGFVVIKFVAHVKLLLKTEYDYKVIYKAYKN